MEIQNYILDQVKNFGGLDMVISEFDKIEFPEEKQYHLNEMKFLFTLVTQMEIDLQEIAITNEYRILSALHQFQETHRQHPGEFTAMIIRIIKAHLNTIPPRYFLKVV